MSDAGSSDNIGKAAYLAYRLNISRMSSQEALNRWHNVMNDDDRAQWVKVYTDVIKYSEYAKSDE